LLHKGFPALLAAAVRPDPGGSAELCYHAATAVLATSLMNRAIVPFMSGKMAPMEFVRPIEAVVPGVQGRILGVLAATTAELNLRTIARLADVSVAHASRVLPQLVQLGIVERRDVPPSALFALVRDHVAARALLDIADARHRVMHEMEQAIAAMAIRPASVIVYGSLARGEANRASDIDVVVVRPEGIDEDDEDWSLSLERWRTHVARASGNRVEVLELAAAELAKRLSSRAPVWQEIRRDGIVVHGSLPL
jgi:predicted nucleotidyltransferase